MEIALLSTTGLPGVCADPLRWDSGKQQQRPGQALGGYSSSVCPQNPRPVTAG